ncbi:MAG: PD-(D/E)XK nuclease family protein [Acidobacteriota bacterium]|nr:PD-(D/E)XK nuclease family protein [Acidobacteriota bacterium]
MISAAAAAVKPHEHSFDPETHTFRIDGVVVPSVTQAIDCLNLRDTEHFTEESRDRGRDVHELCQFYDEGDLFWPAVDPEYEGYLKGWIRFRQENPKFKPRLIEQPVWNDLHRYGGVPDRVEEYGPREAVIDIKSGIRDETTGLQTAGYDDALYPPPGGYRERFGVYLDGAGGYDLVPYRDPNDRYLFLSAVSLANWKLRRKGQKWQE